MLSPSKQISQSTKTTGCWVTYRAGEKSPFRTCPRSCPLNPTRTGSRKIDLDYLKALAKARPRKGYSFTYSHFEPEHWHGFEGINKRKDRTVVNWSLDGLSVATANLKKIRKEKIPAVVVIGEHEKIPEKLKKEIVHCPAETQPVTCGGGIDASGTASRACGNGRPLCGRSFEERNGVIVAFRSHGAGKRTAEDPQTRGGCYASFHNVRKHWEKTANKKQPATDAQTLADWIKLINRGYPRGGQIVRHHIAGDLGRTR